MRILKKIIIVIAILIAIPLVVALFVKKDYAIERQIVINKPKQDVFNYIKFLKNQDNYSKWNMVDPNMKKAYTGTDGTVGFISAWESNNKNIGVGEQEIIKITDGERIDIKLRFKVPFEAKPASTSNLSRRSSASVTVVSRAMVDYTARFFTTPWLFKCRRAN